MSRQNSGSPILENRCLKIVAGCGSTVELYKNEGYDINTMLSININKGIPLSDNATEFAMSAAVGISDNCNFILQDSSS